MSGPTPGPWTAFQSTASFFDVVKGNGEYDPSVASVWASEGRPAGANARLIAAAPDMLAALQAVVSALKNRDATNDEAWAIYARCIAAIDRATGQ